MPRFRKHNNLSIKLLGDSDVTLMLMTSLCWSLNDGDYF